MAYTTRLLSHLSVALLIIIDKSIADETEELYNSIFLFGTDQLSISEIEDALHQLYSLDPYPSIPRIGDDMTPEDIKKVDICFWFRSAEMEESKCTFHHVKLLRANFQRLKSRAERWKQQRRATGNVYNLDKYYNHVLSETISYCSKQIPFLLQELEESTENSYHDLIVLTKEIKDEFGRMNPYEIGDQVGEFILNKSDHATIVQLSQSLNNTGFIKQTYEHLSPCTDVLSVLDRHRGLFELITKMRQFRLRNFVFTSTRTASGKDNMENWASRVSVCAFIRETDSVFESVVEYIAQKEHILDLIAGTMMRPEEGRVHTYDECYNAVFRYGRRKLMYPYILAALRVLDSPTIGLPAQDPRRQEASFWLDAAVNSESKCHADDDQSLRLNLISATTRALGAVRGHRIARGNNLNLENYVKIIRAKRFTYCEFTIGPYLVNRLNRFEKDRHADVQSLFSGYWRTFVMNPDELGKRIAKLIHVRMNRPTFEELVQSLSVMMDISLVKNMYYNYTPCIGLLQLAEEYNRYVSLLTVPGNYQKLNFKMKSWLDKVSLCKFIDETEQVFVRAAQHLLYIRA